jgi:hypothetical protein
MWGFLALMLWTATFGTNLVLNMLLLMLSILLWLEAACQSHPGLYRARTSAVGCCVALWGAVCRGVGGSGRGQAAAHALPGIRFG